MANKLSELIVLIKGGGEVASGIAHRLHRSHFRILLTEVARPLAVSRGTSYCEAVFDGTKTIEGVTARLVSSSPEEIFRAWNRGEIAIIVDPETSIREKIPPDVFVDATMMKRKTGIKITDAPLVIGVGPGFYAGRDVHYVIETNNSNNLGMVISSGEPEEDTGTPVSIGGMTKERVLWAQEAGTFYTDREIGEAVSAGEVVGRIGEQPLEAPVDGILRGLIRHGVKVPERAKLIEIDPVNNRDVCFFIRDRMRAIGGAVLEAIMTHYNTVSYT